MVQFFFILVFLLLITSFVHTFQRHIFEDERAQGQLKFGTSVFHAYVHNWGCQLDYNPRMNLGWGMSDGEGNERSWHKLSKLVAALRYSTKQHRLWALDLKSQHENDVARTKASEKVLSIFLINFNKHWLIWFLDRPIVAT